MEPKVVIEQRHRIGVIRINRPEVLNVVDAEVSKAIEEAIDVFEADDDVWVLILTGTGEKAFSAGMDLQAFATLGPRAKIFTERGGFGGVTQRAFEKPVIAALNGLAYGGGMEMALACDLLVAGEHVRMALPEVKVGLFAGAGGAIRLPRLLPRAIALEMCMTGQPISAARALELGLVNRTCERGKVLEAAIDLAHEVCAASPMAVRQSRRVALASSDVSEPEAWALSFEAARAVLKSEDCREGQRAFAEKRPPAWTGR